MKKLFRFLTLVLFLGGLIFVAGCGKKDKIDYIRIDQSTIPTDLLTTNAQSRLQEIVLEVIYKNDDVKKVNIEKSMISNDDYNKLATAGTHQIIVKYDEFDTSFNVTVSLPQVKTYSVQFNTQGGSSVTSQTINEGSTVNKPTDPTKTGYKFLGWYTDAACTIAVDWQTPITTNVTYYAKWQFIDDPVAEPINYSFYVEDIAGKPLANFYVTFSFGSEVLASGYTGADGVFSADLTPNKYEISVEAREGYYLNETTFETDLLGSRVSTICTIDSLAGIEASETNKYALGDVMYDFTLTDIDGNVLNLYDLLYDYKAVILNFWYVGCSACQYEFPYMVQAYDSTYTNSNGDVVNYSDDIVIIAINNGLAGGGDSPQDVENYRNSMGLNFNVAFDYDLSPNAAGTQPALTTMFNVQAYPTTVIIDSYGLIADWGEGAVTDLSKWTQLFDTYVDPNYTPIYTGTSSGTPEIIKPDITQADSSELEAAINGTNYDGTTYSGNWLPEDNDDKEYSWPWKVTEYDGKNVIIPTNKDINNSFSIVYTKVNLKAGDAFAFDYYSSTEEYDRLYLIADGVMLSTISGMSSTWEKSYAYIADEDREYEFGFCYLKDDSYSAGDDVVYITNVRIEDSSTIDQETYIYRECATGDINELTMSYANYAEVYYNELDGYYHVGSESGPLLLADMLGVTQWNVTNLYTIAEQGLCIGDDGVDYNDLIIEYSIYASNSTIGFTPVTEELANALKQVTKALGDALAKNNENQWLEVCLYYSAYGTNGEEMGLPTIGVCPFEPIEFVGDGINEPATAEADYNRIILPRGIIFSFTPTKSGVYKYYGVGENETIGWLCDENGTPISEEEMGLREYAIAATKGELLDPNFVCYRYLEAGQTYLFRACYYDIYYFGMINVELKYVADSVELFTIASPGFFTSSDAEMREVISGNYIEVELDAEGYYYVIGSKAHDTYVYCDVEYLTNILGDQTIKESLLPPYNAFDNSKDEYGYPIYDAEGYLRYTGFDDDYNIVNFYVYFDPTATTEEDQYGYTKEIEPGYQYIKGTAEEIAKFENNTEYVVNYIEENMIDDVDSELYGCVKVDEEFARVLGLLMDKYTFPDVDYSWLKLCYYYEYLGA